MKHLNVEIKAKTHRLDVIRQLLTDRQADFRGIDHQVDTYFPCPNGRLKLRQGNIECHLIFYQRPDQAGPKPSYVHLYAPQDAAALYEVLVAAYGIWREVRKAREIYFIDNVKFHLDQVDDLGQFVEIEAIDTEGTLGEASLQRQCDQYVALFNIDEGELVAQSYSDMVRKD